MLSTSVQRRNLPWLTAAWLGYWGLLFVVMHVRVPQTTISRLHVSDKTLHFVVYFGLALLGGLALCRRLRRAARNRDRPGAVGGRSWWRTSTPAHLAAWAVCYVLYGAFDEWSQQFVNRTTSLEDWYADVLGIVAATVLLAGWSRFHRLRESRRP